MTLGLGIAVLVEAILGIVLLGFFQGFLAVVEEIGLLRTKYVSPIRLSGTFPAMLLYISAISLIPNSHDDSSVQFKILVFVVVVVINYLGYRLGKAHCYRLSKRRVGN